MVYDVIWDPEALAAAERFLVNDREGLAAVFDRTDALAHDPRPSTAMAGGSDHWRLRIGAYRVLYRITDTTVTVDVIHLGRAG
ncbi:type II toxin-antitoxin system RelE family toxin [Nocardioides humi]|uniref:mRNA interferase RelE/StbE n=1 Tax=Nocardioides humi TaxID=449461 RepID=A0ABN1ZUF2_9ACTN|nr:type II toxin-antitoxin system RelE/ParE family toxin [Nocardioides humi]